MAVPGSGRPRRGQHVHRGLPERVLFALSDACADRGQREAYQEALADPRSEDVQLVPARDGA